MIPMKKVSIAVERSSLREYLIFFFFKTLNIKRILVMLAAESRLQDCGENAPSKLLKTYNHPFNYQ
jgi:hypothetical protein